MEPALSPNRFIVATGVYTALETGDIVVLMHNGTEKVKRVSDIRANKLFVLGDNANESTDSRQFGWISKQQIVGKVVWPK